MEGFHLIDDSDDTGIFAGVDASGFADPSSLYELANATMPFGKYSGRYLIDLPESYVLWLKGKGYPSGALGERLRAIEEIKVNGLEGVLRPLISRR
jgi:uncharacterized protein